MRNVREIIALAVCISTGGLAVRSTGQVAAPQPAYDVVSIRLNQSGGEGESFSTDKDAFTASNVSLYTLITKAYDLPCNPSNLPKWVGVTRFDVKAKIVDVSLEELTRLTDEQRRVMLRSLLEDRFHIKVHPETKMFPSYELVVTKGGSKLTPFVPQGDGAVNKAGENASGVSTMSSDADGLRDFKAVGVSVGSLNGPLSREVQRRVIDKTGLNGIYSFSLKWAPGMGNTDSSTGNTGGPSIFTALQEQLGLKLQAVDAPLDFLVVDHVEMPSAN